METMTKTQADRIEAKLDQLLAAVADAQDKLAKFELPPMLKKMLGG